MLPSSFGKYTGKSVEGKCVILSTSTSVTKNTFAHSSVSQEDIFVIAYLDSCLQIIRLSPNLSVTKKKKAKEKKRKCHSLNKFNLSVGTCSFQPKVTLQEVALAFCTGIFLPRSRYYLDYQKEPSFF